MTIKNLKRHNKKDINYKKNLFLAYLANSMLGRKRRYFLAQFPQSSFFKFLFKESFGKCFEQILA
mgnify:CR=1 FL=1